MKIDFTEEGLALNTFPNNRALFAEMSPLIQVESFLDSLNREPVILLASTQSEQYDAVCFARRYEKRGGAVIGYWTVNAE